MFTFPANSYLERCFHGQTKKENVSIDSKILPTNNINAKFNIIAEAYGMWGKGKAKAFKILSVVSRNTFFEMYLGMLGRNSCQLLTKVIEKLIICKLH